MAATSLTAFAIAAAGGVLAAMAFSQTVAEFTPYFVGGTLSEQRFAAISSGQFLPATSRWSRDLFLSDCLEIPGTPFIFTQSAEQRAPFLRKCREAALDVVAATPTASNAWLVVATTSGRLGEFDISRDALAKSKHFGPNIEWLANGRSRLVETYFDELGPSLLAEYQSDLEILARERDGIEVLIQRYLRNPEHRAAYQQAVQAADANQQQRFITRIRARIPGNS